MPVDDAPTLEGVSFLACLTICLGLLSRFGIVIEHTDHLLPGIVGKIAIDPATIGPGVLARGFYP